MTYEDQVAIGANLNSAIERTLEQQLGESNPQLIAALVQLKRCLSSSTGQATKSQRSNLGIKAKPLP
jgi:hypothetical protein